MKEKEILVNGFLFSTEKSKLDVPYIHKFLSEKSYWAKGIPYHFVQRSISHSLSIGVYLPNIDTFQQVGFARVTTDFTTFAYLGDVFIDETFRGRGLSKALMDFIMEIEELKTVRRFILLTSDAHTLYAKFGFKPIQSPDRFMEIHQPDIYKQLSNQ